MDMVEDERSEQMNTAKLCEIINQSNSSGRQYRWPTVHRMLIECGYCVSEGRKDHRRFALISQPIE